MSKALLVDAGRAFLLTWLRELLLSMSQVVKSVQFGRLCDFMTACIRR